MSLRKHSKDIEKILINDETLLRLLYYKPQNRLDDPLSLTKSNILDMANKWDIIDDRIVSAPKFEDLETGTEPKCRLLFYPAYGRSTNNNYLFSNQEYKFEIYVHFDYQIDKRLEWISDRINELMFNQRITGHGKVEFKDRRDVSAPKNYLGFRLIYEFLSGNS